MLPPLLLRLCSFMLRINRLPERQRYKTRLFLFDSIETCYRVPGG